MSSTTNIDPGSRLSMSVINEEIRDKVEPIFRNHILMAAMRKFGRISYNHSSPRSDWHPRVYRRPLVPGVGNVTERTFPQHQSRIKMTLPWRSYTMGESVTKFERLASQDRETVLFDSIAKVVAEMSEDFVENFNDELFVDGNLAGSTDRIHGLESIFSVTGSVINIESTGNGVVGVPDDNYAGKSTALGELGGDWTPDDDREWPTGTGKTEYHALSPIVVDYNNTSFGGTATNWDYQWRQAINYLITYGTTLQKQKYDLLLLNPELLRRAKDSLIDKERFVSTPSSTLTDLGFTTLMYEGLELDQSYGVPSGVGYALRWGQMELRSMQSQLVMPDDDFDIVTSQRLYGLDCYCNMRFKTPAYFGKLQGITTAGT